MTTVVWPSYALPLLPLTEGLVQTPADTRVAVAVELGPPRNYRTRRSAPHYHDLTVEMTNDEYALFLSFGEWELHGFADWFTTDVFVIDDYVAIDAQIAKGSIKPKRQDGRWMVSFRYRTKNPPVMSSAALDAIIGADPGDGSIPVWPADHLLPEPLNAEFAHQLPDRLIASDLDGLIGDQVLPFRTAPATFDCAWPFTRAQYGIWRAFNLYRVKGGWLSMPIFLTPDYQTMRARTAAGSETVSADGEDWIVRCKVEIEDMPPLSIDDTDAELLTAGLPAGLDDLVDLMEHVLRVDIREAHSP